jgi:hypothetical protein
MPKIKTDEQILNEYLPKLKAFAGERLTAGNAKRIYNFLQPYHYDTDGWILYQAAQGILQTDVDSEFPVEDNMGYFEALDGYGLLKWLEIAKFADKEYGWGWGENEIMTSHTLDESAAAYREYQGKLYAAAVRGVMDELAEKQPCLLEGFWNRLSYIENILEKGWPTRDDLNEKIKREAKEVFDSASTDDLTGFHSEVEIKHQLLGALRDTSMTDETVQALWIKDNVLDSVYRFFVEESKDNQIHLAVWEYLDKAERAYLAERVFDRAKLEYEDYVDRVKEMPPEKIIDEAYKLTILYDLHISLEPETSKFSAEQLKALLSLDSPLWSLYNEWQRRDVTYLYDMKDVIEDVADEQAAMIEDESYEIDPDPFGQRELLSEDEDELEP